MQTTLTARTYSLMDGNFQLKLVRSSHINLATKGAIYDVKSIPELSSST